MSYDRKSLYSTLESHGQDQLLQFWDDLNEAERGRLAQQIDSIDFALMKRLIDTWVLDEPAPEHFGEISPVPVIPAVDPQRADAVEALALGEEALRAGRVGLFLVAGGQGTRLGFDGPKGAYPIGPVSKRSLFAFHAEKIIALQRRYGCELPWYIMVSEANGADTQAFFETHDWFGLKSAQVMFLKQRMVPCVSEAGKFMLEEKGSLAMNPNGHGGCLPAMVENGVLGNARDRGVDLLSFFQVDNWAVKVADPYFIGYHIGAQAEMSSKNHLKQEVREAVGVHCVCDGKHRVIEYSELDLYPQLLETGAGGEVLFNAGNPAIHILSVDFVDRMYQNFEAFPWHRAHKKVPYINAAGEPVNPECPNAYKFETFVFDALRFVNHAPVALAINRLGEYTPIKCFEGENSVVDAWASQASHWAAWLEAAGHAVERDAAGLPAVPIEISPAYALTEDEFMQRAGELDLPARGGVVIGPEGTLLNG